MIPGPGHLASPVWIYQLWAFITPGLTKKERRYTLSYMFASVPLFLAGIYAGWLMLPNIVRGLTSFTPAGGTNIMKAADYLQFALQLMLFMGVAFLVPVLLFALNAGRHGPWQDLFEEHGASPSSWCHCSAAMAAPGSDVMSMFFLACAAAGAVSSAAIGLCILNDKRRDRRDAKKVKESEAMADVATPSTDLEML